MTELIIILSAGFLTGITTILFGFGGGFVVVPFVYQLISASGEHPGQAMHIAVATSTTVMILNAGYATYGHWRSGSILRETVVPLIFFIAIGALAGALAATLMTDRVIRLLFIAYMVVTIADCLFHQGFLQRPARRALSSRTHRFGGALIGCVAAMLGVGGSVMTVPLLRRHGYEMKYCVSAANPLSIAVAVMGAATYGWLGQGKIAGAAYLGYVNLVILALLALAGTVGIAFAKRALPRIDDTLHARIYVLLLILVLVAIAW
ncbi:TPA: sulfite exporter TauE/SafE family protein [Serratia odorifera]|nr:sulfite exporter TauE/SafE family protein [Serratia odorifera]